MDLAIEAGEISAVTHCSKLYVFWTQVDRKEISYIDDAKSKFGGYVFNVYVKFSFLDEHGKWSAPQKVSAGYIRLAEDVVFARAGGATTALPDDDKTAAVEMFQQQVFKEALPDQER